MYEKFYGLRTSPFRLNPDPAFFFGSKGHKRALAYLRYGINQKEGFIVITGTPGTGKTTLARALLGEMGRHKTVVSELNTTHLEADDVLHMVAASYGLQHEGAPKSTLLKRLEEFFISRYRAGYHVLLIVDESQNLPKDSLEELRMLSNFYIGKDALVQIFLLGQEQFRQQLYSQEMEQLRQRVVASCHLEPLDQAETKEYIYHRLNVASWQGDPQFSERAFARIYTVTQGVPRRINTFCDRLLLYGALEDKHAFKDEDIKAVAKELSIETSPKDLELKDIKPADQEESTVVAPTDVVEELTDFSDEVEDVVPVKIEQEAVKMPEIDLEQDQGMQDNESSTYGSEPDGLKLASNGEEMEGMSEPLPAQDTAEASINSKPAWWDLVALAVNFQTDPAKYKGITSSKSPLAAGITDLFKIAIDKKTIPGHMRIGELENVSDEKIKVAIRFYIKKVLLSSTADYYRRLGVERNASQEHIKTHYKLLFRIFQPDKESGQSEWDETFTRRINQAYGALRSEQKRKEYDEFLLSLDAKNEGIAENPEQIISPRDYDAQTDSAVFQPDVEENKKSGLAVAAVIIIVILFSGVGAGYYYYQNHLLNGEEAFDITKITDLLSGENPSQGQDSIVDKESAFDENLPTIELARELNLPSEPIDLSEEIKSIEDANPEEQSVFKPLDDIQNELLIDSGATSAAERIANSSALAETSIAENKLEIETSKVIESLKTSESVKPDPNAVIVETKPISKPEPVKKVTPKPEPIKKVTPKPVPVKKAEPKPVVKPVVTEIAKAETKPVMPLNPPMPKIKEPSASDLTIATAESTISNNILEYELNNFISGFTLSYEEGEIDNFIELFTLDAATNDAQGRRFIKKDYEALFESTEMRVIDLQGLIWNIDGGQALGNGAFVVTVLRKGGDTMRKFTGRIKLEVTKQNNDLKISGMYHSYGDDE